MTQKDKQLLLKDLCARLPYKVRGKVKADGVDTSKYDIDGFPLEITFDVDVELLKIDISNDELFVSTFDDNEDLGNYIEECQTDGTPWTIDEFTPHLRPMSSMTEEERKEYERFSCCSIGLAPILMDWLYSHRLDCCELIPKGLALVAPEEMYNIKEK